MSRPASFWYNIGMNKNGMEEGYPFDFKKPWGDFRQFTLNAPTTVKIITVLPGQILSLQSHTKRSEFWRVISGSGFVVIGEQRQAVSLGDEKMIPTLAKHRMEAGPEGMQILEIAFGVFDEDDITRYEDKYGRENK